MNLKVSVKINKQTSKWTFGSSACQEVFKNLLNSGYKGVFFILELWVLTFDVSIQGLVRLPMVSVSENE